MIDDAGKVAADKFDDVVRKIDAGDFTDDELKRLVVETKDALTNSQKGVLGEAVSEVVYKNNPAKEGFEQVASKISSNNGIDGLYFKYAKDANGEYLLDASGSKIVEAIDVVEAKYGSSTLSTLADGTKQMSDDWVMYSAERMMDSADVAVQEAGELLFETLTSSPEKITKYLDNIVKDTGEVVTKVLDSAGNKIN